MCKYPVGEGAKRVTTGLDVSTGMGNLPFSNHEGHRVLPLSI
jgi:hypothetical protein